MGQAPASGGERARSVKLMLLGLAAACAVLLVAVVAGSGKEGSREPRAATAAAVDRPRVVPPRPPARYRVPRAAVRISTAPALRRALAAPGRSAIVLAPGVYGGRRPFLNPHGHHIYSARLGRAVLRAGLSLGGNDGPGGALVRGLAFDVADPRRTVDGAAITVWGSGRGSRILDVKLHGNRAVPAGLAARRPDGLVVRRVVARRFTDFGVLVDANDLSRGRLRDRAIVEDVQIAGVGRRNPRSANGSAEACVWIGNTASVRRVRVRSCAWMGLWTGTATEGASFSDIDVDRTPTGVYVEHFTSDSTFRRLRVGRRVRLGVNAEWADPDWGGLPASVGNIIEDSVIESSLAGIYLDEGTTRTTVRGSAFANQSWGAIGDYRGNGNAAYGNDYRGIDPGAVAVRHDHLSTFREG
jgi:hypothetical protein